VIAAGNLGCIMQIAAGTDLPAVHTVELIDWATGGPRPPVLQGRHQTEATNPAMHSSTTAAG
jgi:glycolate oxidase iron-sulfur subunit